MEFRKPVTDDLDAEQRALAEKRALRRAQRLAEPLLPRDRSEPAPLSFGQQHFWLSDRMRPGNPAFNCCVASQLEGDLNIEVLRQAIELTVERQEILRTVYRLTPEGPRQFVESSSPWVLEQADVRGAPDLARALRETVIEHVIRPFDLEHGPVFRMLLARFGERQYVLSIAIHHIAFDGLSLRCFFGDVFAAYFALTQGLAPPGKLDIQYADFAAWQRARLAEGRSAEDLEFWRRKLAGCAPFILAPFDRPPTFNMSPYGRRRVHRLADDLAALSERYAEENGAKVFDVYLASFLALLHRLCGQNDLLVGAPSSGRVRPEIDPLIGYFVNTLVLRSDASDDPSFAEFLRRTRDSLSEAHSHKDVPIDRLIEDLNPPRASGRPTLVQFMFQMRRRSWPSMEGAGLLITEYRPDPGVSPFELSITLLFEPDGTIFRWESSKDLFDEETIDRWHGHLAALLRSGLSDPSTPLSRLDLLGADERRRMLGFAAATAPKAKADLQPAARVHEIFEEHARRTPRAVAAVSSEGEEITYETLNRRANRLARKLIEAGVRPGSVVAVALEASPDLPAAWLAVLKAGAAYLPLDPREPEGRAKRMLEDARVSAAIVRRGGLELLEGAPRIEIEETRTNLGSGDDNSPSVPGSARDLAYVIYTSGSTGPPKGVAALHRSVCGLVRETNYIELGPQDVVVQAAAVSFDATTFEIWGALLNGGRIAFVPKDSLLSPAELGAWLRQSGATAMFITTALFNRIAAAAPEALSSLKTLLTGGEAADPAAMAKIMRMGAPGRLVHVYGPTETTTFATWDEILAPPEGGAPVPIGRAVTGARVHVLDSSGGPAPIGVAGEICIGGRGVARGYLNDPALTSEKFVDDPFAAEFGEETGAKLYRTGDLGRVRADGRIEFIGRKDRQFKIRGFRVEPGEIEAELAKHPAIAQCAVLAEPAGAGEIELAAFAVAVPGAAPAEAELKAHLRKQLPEHMIPLTFDLLERLPVTANGKLDRAALLRARRAPGAAGTALAEPGDELEYYLLQVWRSALGGRLAQMDDDFFDSGGHSLAALGLLEEIRRTFGRSFPASALFGARTPRAFAGLIREAAIQKSTLDLVEIRHGAGEVPWICAQAGPPGGLYVFGSLARLFKSERPVLGLEFDALDGETVLYGSVESTAQHYIDRLKAAGRKGPYLLGGYCHGGLVAYEMARRLAAEGERVPLVIIFDAIAPGAAAAGLRRVAAAWADLRGLSAAEEAKLYLRAREMLRFPKLALKFAPKLISPAGWKEAAAKTAKFIRQARAKGNVEAAAPHETVPPAPGRSEPQSVTIAAPEETAPPSPINNGAAVPFSIERGSAIPEVPAVAAVPAAPARESRPGDLVYRSQPDAVAAYVPGRYEGRVLLFQPEKLIKSDTDRKKSTSAWERCVGKGLKIVTVGGDHYTMFYRPNVEKLAAAVEEALAEAERDASNGA